MLTVAFAILAVTALLLPALAIYLAIGVLAGPLALLALHRSGVKVDPLRDTPVAVAMWPRVIGQMLHQAA